jgi:hypothetical protein
MPIGRYFLRELYNPEKKCKGLSGAEGEEEGAREGKNERG